VEPITRPGRTPSHDADEDLPTMTTPSTSTTSNYALALSEEEARRYRLMAQSAVADEFEDLALAGIVPGARVADVGCGPGATLAALAGIVAPTGTVAGVGPHHAGIRPARH